MGRTVSPGRAAGPVHPGGRRLAGGDDGGSGTVVALLVVLVVGVLLGGIVLLGQAHLARGTAQAAADLGALAGATARRHREDACAVAAATVTRNGAELVECELLDAGVVRVLARVATVAGTAGADARAGPASARAG